MAYQQNQYKNRKRRPSNNEVAPEAEAVEAVLRGIGQVIMAIFGLFKGGSKGSSKGNQATLTTLREAWEQVELHVLQEAGQAQAISDADKILDNALIAFGYHGESMADRLRAAETRFSADLYQQIWTAHKLRNTLAHELGARASTEQARQAITTFRQALYQLGVLS